MFPLHWFKDVLLRDISDIHLVVPRIATETLISNKVIKYFVVIYRCFTKEYNSANPGAQLKN